MRSGWQECASKSRPVVVSRVRGACAPSAREQRDRSTCSLVVCSSFCVSGLRMQAQQFSRPMRTVPPSHARHCPVTLVVLRAQEAVPRGALWCASRGFEQAKAPREELPQGRSMELVPIPQCTARRLCDCRKANAPVIRVLPYALYLPWNERKRHPPMGSATGSSPPIVVQ